MYAIELADKAFLKLMNVPDLYLPIRWDGGDFEKALSDVLDLYIEEMLNVGKNCSNTGNQRGSVEMKLDEIMKICKKLKHCVRYYHCGLPQKAYSEFSEVMLFLIKYPLRIYQKSGWQQPLDAGKLKLYRLRKIQDGKKYRRKDIFHVPAAKRAMVSTCRYSIAGYPSLYLTTSVELGAKELRLASKDEFIISQYKLNRNMPKINIQVLELGIKPQDFFRQIFADNEQWQERLLNEIDLQNIQVKKAYLRWYPLIAACSFIRVDKKSPFASEYIIPQLLMQWIRINAESEGKLMGLRYFSCASKVASEMGFDYVFPVNNWEYKGNYCSVLRDAFDLTEPVHITDYRSWGDCIYALDNMDFKRA